jgi:hypothetical protein
MSIVTNIPVAPDVSKDTPKKSHQMIGNSTAGTVVLWLVLFYLCLNIHCLSSLGCYTLKLGSKRVFPVTSLKDSRCLCLDPVRYHLPLLGVHYLDKSEYQVKIL